MAMRGMEEEGGGQRWDFLGRYKLWKKEEGGEGDFLTSKAWQ